MAVDRVSGHDDARRSWPTIGVWRSLATAENDHDTLTNEQTGRSTGTPVNAPKQGREKTNGR